MCGVVTQLKRGKWGLVSVNDVKSDQRSQKNSWGQITKTFFRSFFVTWWATREFLAVSGIGFHLNGIILVSESTLYLRGRTESGRWNRCLFLAINPGEKEWWTKVPAVKKWSDDDYILQVRLQDVQQIQYRLWGRKGFWPEWELPGILFLSDTNLQCKQTNQEWLGFCLPQVQLLVCAIWQVVCRILVFRCSWKVKKNYKGWRWISLSPPPSWGIGHCKLLIIHFDRLRYFTFEACI